MKKDFLFLLVYFCFFQTGLYAQVSLENQKITKKFHRGAVNVEAGGATGWYSVNFERFLRHKSAPDFYVLVGVGYSEISYKYRKWIDFPLKFKVGKEFGRFRAEIGLSKLLAYDSGRSWLHPEYYYPYYLNRFSFFEFGGKYQLWKRCFIGIDIFPIRLNDTDELNVYLNHINHDLDDLLEKKKKRIWWGGIKFGVMF